ncbi:OB-fold nucleic acid binding domain-containing protein [Candidatus Pacearchaeota archaeon]|nr:OB-fold nucleic acid binding domain-containing protein [Candidatus Pacearchaeota archaeon]
MNEKSLLILSLALSIFGIILLFYLSSFPPSQSKISELESRMINSRVKIFGQLIQISNQKTFFIMKIKDSTGTIEVTTEKPFPINSTLEITGKIQEYKNKKQINAEKIVLLFTPSSYTQ